MVLSHYLQLYFASYFTMRLAKLTNLPEIYLQLPNSTRLKTHMIPQSCGSELTSHSYQISKFHSSKEKLENALFTFSRRTKQITQNRTFLLPVFLNCKDCFLTFSGMKSNHLARYQASKQGSWPTVQEHGWLLPSSPAAQIPAS